MAAAFGHIDFATDDGLYIALAGFVEEVGGGEKIAVVGDGHRRHFLAGGFIEELRGLARPIEQAVIGVNVEVDELRVAHSVSLSRGERKGERRVLGDCG